MAKSTSMFKMVYQTDLTKAILSVAERSTNIIHMPVMIGKFETTFTNSTKKKSYIWVATSK